MVSPPIVLPADFNGLERLPTQHELPYDDGEPMESDRHVLQMVLLIETLRRHWEKRETGYCAGNMFVYFSPEQLKNRDFRGPDFFVVRDAPRGERKSWVVWDEKLRPDVVIELLSESTAEFDKHEKKEVYQNELRVPDYFWYDPFSGELAGFTLKDGVYQPLDPDEQGRLIIPSLGLALVRREGTYKDLEVTWLRFETQDGQLLLHDGEMAQMEMDHAFLEKARAEQEKARAEQEKARAEQEKARAEQEKAHAKREKAHAKREKARAEREKARAELLAAKLRELGIDPDALK
ncbi:MAG: Uma2 family endonuclease [Blastocatellia bacterium]